MADLTPDEVRALLIERISHRAERLARILRTQHCPTNVWVMMALHLFQTVVLVAGKELLQQAIDWSVRQNAESLGVCRFCLQREVVEKHGMCQHCWNELEAEDREADRQIALAEMRTRGGGS
jgi:hypothetical protein